MPIVPVSFGLESRPGRYGPDGGARLINVYPEQLATDAKAPYAAYVRPGLREFGTLDGVGGFRGGLELDGVAYIIGGAAVNKVQSDGSANSIGGFGGSGPVFMARNRKSPHPQIALVSGGLRAYIENDTVTAITDEHLPPPIGVCFIGGYHVFAISDGRYFWSAIDDVTSVDALDFASAETYPDGLVGVFDRNQEIVLPGAQSIEFHALTGSARVFERVPQTTLQIGCLSGAAVKNVNGVLIFPASDSTVRLLNDYSPEVVSNEDVERDIDALADKSALTAHTFSIPGHHFYCLNASDWTWACDLRTRKWLQWKSYGEKRWRAEGSVQIGGKVIAGDFESNKLYQIDPTCHSDAGSYLVMELISGQVGAYPNRIIADELYVDTLAGQGKQTGADHEKNPKIMLRTSDDDGYSWSDEMTQPVGKIGQFKQEVSFTRLGASGEDGFRFHLSMSAPVNRSISRAALRYTPIGP